MTSPKLISPEFVTWCEFLFLWSAVSYGITSDPLEGEAPKFPWKLRIWWLILRAAVAGVLSYAMARSLTFSSFSLVICFAQPLLRYRLDMRWLAEFECLWMSAVMAASLMLIRHFHLASRWAPAALTLAQTAALCIVGSTLVVVVRGGTYVVREVLKKAGTLPSRTQGVSAGAESRVSFPVAAEVPAMSPSSAPKPDPGCSPAPSSPSTSPARSETPAVPSAPIPIQPLRQEVPVSATAATAGSSQGDVDLEELNRGRLIGNLERIVLTMVVAAGSYAALAFLVAAKGLVRSEEFEKSRDFTEYFLIGSLSSVLVALCAGLALRYALLALWPDLLVFQMQQ
jgi:hypothetical protein